jgi:nicotinamide-nucleotide amidase
MKAQIISIGDEILIGQIVNSNAAYIAERLNEISIDVIKMSVVADDVEKIKTELDEAFKNVDLVLMTGGLGPTHDDVTLNAIVDYYKSELVFNVKVFEKVTEFLTNRNIVIEEIHKTQALVPKIAEVLPNSSGTAPGMWIEENGKILVAMPGVPREMKSIINDSVYTRLQTHENLGKKTTVRKTLLTTGMPESELYMKLGNIDDLLEGAQLAFLPNQFGVRMRITASAESKEVATDLLLSVEQKIRSKVGKYIYGSDNTKLEEVVARLLFERNLTLSTAESCTGGLIASRLTDIPGASSFFERGIVSYSNGAKVELLNVSEEILQTYGAVSKEVAEQMAVGLRLSCGTDLSLAVTGIMGPGGASINKPVGLVYIALASENECKVQEFRFGEDRLTNKDKTSQKALDMLRRYLHGIVDA